MLSHLGRLMMCRRQFLSALWALTLSPTSEAKAPTPALIPVPPDFPRPKFHCGQQVLTEWDDECGCICTERGIVMGMIFEPSDYPRREWTYLVHWADGICDGTFLYERDLKAL